MLTLSVEKRKSGTGPALRKEGKIPAVYYGPKTESVPIAVDRVAFEKTLKEAGESSVISLISEGKNIDVIIHDIVSDPVTDEPIHADFYAVDKDTKVTVHVPLMFTGEAPAAKLGGVVIKVLHELEVEGLPKDLPHDIVVDLSALSVIGSHIALKDLAIPSGVTVKLLHMDDTVASVAEPKAEKEEEVAPVDLSTIEVEKKGKKEEEGGEAEETKK